MTELLGYAFMQRALLAGALIGAVCAIIGVYVVLRGLSFIGAGIAHASFGGVALGFLLGLNPVLTAVVFCLATAWGIGLVARKSQVKEDTAVGIFFASTMALGILFIGLMQGYNVDLFGYLFGSILAVTAGDVWITFALGASVLLVVGLFFKELLFVTFDPEMAEVTGVPASKLYFLLISLIALTVVLSIKVATVLHGLDLVLYPGEFAALVGDNGIGKSTVGKVLAGLLRPKRGRVSWHSPSDHVPRVGLVLQDPLMQLFCDTVEEEVAFGPHNFGRFLPQDVDRVLTATGLVTLRARSPFALSCGQQQRTALAAILSLQPELLILDEPTLGQDWGHLSRIMDFLIELNKQGMTILVITHDYKLVCRYAQRILVLSEGGIVADGAPRLPLWTETKQSAQSEETQ